MATSLTRVAVEGFDTARPGDPVASVQLSGLTFQEGETALWKFVDDVEALVAAAQNVGRTVVTKYESVSTVVT
jgi:hypothetical protein